MRIRRNINTICEFSAIKTLKIAPLRDICGFVSLSPKNLVTQAKAAFTFDVYRSNDPYLRKCRQSYKFHKSHVPTPMKWPHFSFSNEVFGSEKSSEYMWLITCADQSRCESWWVSKCLPCGQVMVDWTAVKFCVLKLCLKISAMLMLRERG